jgi:drug/metabolite transporter (DMT)-like permease
MPAPAVLPAFLSAFFFAFNATCASHSIRLLGTLRANLSRLVIGTVVLGLFAHTLGGGFSSAGTAWFLLSGLIGLGAGDLGTYGALPLLGSRITILVVQCLAAPLAALGEWWWLGTRLSSAQILWGTVILLGVFVAIAPSRSDPPRVRVKAMGFLYGFIGACGQGLGAALLTRKAVMVAAAAGESVSNVTFGLTSAYERLLAGLAFTLGWFWVLRLVRRLPTSRPQVSADARAPWLWTLANGLAGPVAGVGCYQWALATTPSGVVLPIVATMPLISIPIAFWLEGDRPSRRSIVGGLIAVAGCIVLTLVTHHTSPGR